MTRLGDGGKEKVNCNTDFMKQHDISAEHTIKLMGNYYSHNNAAITWEKTAEEELVELINLDF